MTEREQPPSTWQPGLINYLQISYDAIVENVPEFPSWRIQLPASSRAHDF